MIPPPPPPRLPLSSNPTNAPPPLDLFDRTTGLNIGHDFGPGHENIFFLDDSNRFLAKLRRSGEDLSIPKNYVLEDAERRPLYRIRQPFLLGLGFTEVSHLLYPNGEPAGEMKKEWVAPFWRHILQPPSGAALVADHPTHVSEGSYLIGQGSEVVAVVNFFYPGKGASTPAKRQLRFTRGPGEPPRRDWIVVVACLVTHV